MSSSRESEAIKVWQELCNIHACLHLVVPILSSIGLPVKDTARDVAGDVVFDALNETMGLLPLVPENLALWSKVWDSGRALVRDNKSGRSVARAVCRAAIGERKKVCDKT